MRKLSLVFLSLGLAASTLTASPSSADPYVFASVDQMAEADWIVMRGPRAATWYFGGGIRMVDPNAGGHHLFGFVGRGDCTVRAEKELVEINCSARAKLRKVTSKEFDIDPALRSARLRLSQHGLKHAIDWKAIGPAPMVDGGISGGDGFAMAAGYVSRQARAKGKVFRRNLSSRGGGSGLSFAFLVEGALVGAFADYDRTIDIDGHEVVLSARVRVAR